MANKQKEKKAFKMPHLFWIMMGLLMVASAATYIIPAGQFAVDPETGKILGDQFNFLGYQTPVSPVAMFMSILEGMTSSALIGYSVMIGGAGVGVVMATGAFDEFLDWAIWKLKDSDDTILVMAMYTLMVFLGAFGGSDALIAIVPVGVMFAKKMKLDPVVAMGVTTYATLIGFGSNPRPTTTQMLMEVQLYGTFFTMSIIMIINWLIGMVFLVSYVKKIKKDPTKSLMWDQGWRPDADGVEVTLKETKLQGKNIAILLIYFGQFAIMVGYPMITGDTSITFPMMIAMGILVAIVTGLIAGFSFDRIGNEVAKGISSMAFVAFVIGLAKVMSIVMTNGNILHTIVYWITKPLMGLPLAVASVGMTWVVCIINLFIPSASSKAAILVPIMRPIADALGMMPELAVQAFQFGDGFTNLVSPFLGWTVGSLATVGLPYDKWVKWVLPKILTLLASASIIMFCLTTFGWTPF